MQNQPAQRFELVIQERRNERTSEDRKLQSLKERLQATVKAQQAIRAN